MLNSGTTAGHGTDAGLGFTIFSDRALKSHCTEDAQLSRIILVTIKIKHTSLNNHKNHNNIILSIIIIISFFFSGELPRAPHPGIPRASEAPGADLTRASQGENVSVDGLGRVPSKARVFWLSQRLQYPLIKEYSLDHIGDPTIM